MTSFTYIPTAPHKVWKKEELAFIKIIKKNPILYVRRKIPIKTPMKLWKSIAEEMRMSLYECKSKWQYWKKYYITLRKQELQGATISSKFLDGALRFLDDEIEELIQIRKRQNAKKKTVTVLSMNSIDQLLKERDHNPDIDSATLQYLYEILTERIEMAMKSQIYKDKYVKRVELGKTPEPSQTVENTQIAKPFEANQNPLKPFEPQASTVNQVESNNSDNNQKTKLIIKRPGEINMDSIISAIATQALQTTSNRNRQINESEYSNSSILVNEKPVNKLHPVENPTIDLDDDDIDQAESLTSTSNNTNEIQSQTVESNIAKSTENYNIDTVFGLHCSRKDPRLFFKDLAEYIIATFSEAKQNEIRLKICTVVTEVELEEMERM